MGLFDTVYVRHHLFSPQHHDITFQTKGLDCCMYRYLICPKGLLWCEKSCMFGDATPPEVEWTPFHGDFYIYGSNRSTGEWIEYAVRFTNDVLERAVLCTSFTLDGFPDWGDTPPFGEHVKRACEHTPPVFPPRG